MKAFLNQLMTESNNHTQDVFRWLAVLSVLGGIIYAGYDLIHLHNPFNFATYGTGVGALLAGAGAALAMKPESKNVPEPTTLP